MQGIERWKGRVALITGASSGIGRAIATTLAQAGMKVALAARRVERLEELSQELQSHGAETLTLATDLRREEDILKAFQAVKSQWGGVHVLVNNAGLGHKAPLLSGESELWREMLEVNVLALCIATREAVAQMREHGQEGYILHISSMAGHRVPNGSGVYSASKYAVRSLTEGLRLELHAAKLDVRVTAISPGLVETEFAAQYHKTPDAEERSYGQFKVLESEDIADTVKFLLASPLHAQFHDLLIRPTAQPL